MTEQVIRVVLADDHHMVRESLAIMLDNCPQIAVVAQAADGDETLAVLAQQTVDVLVQDYSMPGIDGVALLETVAKRYPAVRTVVLTMHEHEQYALRCLDAGAAGYLLKSDAVLKLIDAIQAAMAGERYVSEAVALTAATHAPPEAGLESLSPREFEMLCGLAKGLRVSDCAREMGVSDSSASTYRRRLMQKLRLNTLGELVRWATERGIDS